jgi:hypothetical protein
VNHRPRIIVNSAPIPRPSARRIELGKREWELVPPSTDWGGTLAWQRPSVFRRMWSLEAEHGTLAVLHEVNLLRRIWRAEAASGGWTLVRSWHRTTTLTDESDAQLLLFQSGWLGRGQIVPVSGPELSWRRDWFRGHVVTDSEGHELMRLARAPGLFHFTTNVTLAQEARERADLLPLLALAWLVTLSGRHRHYH